VNHLAPFLLTNLLLDRLAESAPARVVMVSYRTQDGGSVDFDDLQGEHGYSGVRAYSQSKLANVLFTYELARRTPDASVTFNAVRAGVVGTADHGPVQRVLATFVRPFTRRQARDAATPIDVASAPELERVTGRDFDNGRSAELRCDAAAAARLWQVSADLVGVAAPTQPQ
jgi:NAD(P)-dependent dehydrogenase (short-subunit alcohol dehydrogenase family)